MMSVSSLFYFNLSFFSSSLCLLLALLLPPLCTGIRGDPVIFNQVNISSSTSPHPLYIVSSPPPPHSVQASDLFFQKYLSSHKFNDNDEERKHHSHDENKQIPLEQDVKHHRSVKRRRDAYNANTARQRAPYIMDHPEDVTVQKHSPTTLNCKADGNPPPVIEWFKDGEKVKHTGNRMVLPSGSLFFLHVIQNKDTGVYWCTAINNLGSVASRKATLSLPSKHSRINKPSSSTVGVTGNSLDAVTSSSTTITVDIDDPDDSNGSDELVPTMVNGENNGINGASYPQSPSSQLNPSQPFNSKSNSKLSSSHDGSNHHHHHTNHYQRDPLKEPWFIIVATLTVMFILSSGVLIFLMRARSSSSAHAKTPVVQHINVSMLPNDLGANNINGNKIASSIVHDSVWIDHSWFNGTNGSNGNASNLNSAMATSLATMFGSNSRIPSSSSKFIREITCNGATGAGGTTSSTLEDTYSEIESNDYAVVADIQNLSTFKSRSNNGGHSGSNNLICNSSINNNAVNGGSSHRSNSPGPYATTNLINITPNALFRVSNDITNCKSYRGLNPLVDHISSFSQLQSPSASNSGNVPPNGMRKLTQQQQQQQQQQNASPYHKLKS